MKTLKDLSSSLWREMGVLIAIASVLVIVRLPGIFAQAPHQDEYFTLLEVAGNWNPVWSDEITTAGQAARVLKESTTLKNVTASLRTSVHPPLYYWGLSLWRGWFGYSIEVARGLSLLFSVGAALGFYGLLRAADLKYPWIPTLAYGLSSQAVFWGQNARDYAFASFFVLSAAYFAYRAVQTAAKESKRRVTLTYDLALILSLGLAFASNYFAIFSTAVIFLLYGIYVGLRDIWRVVRSTLLAFLVHVPLLPFVWHQYRIRGGVFSGFPGIYHQIIEMVKANYSVMYSPFFRSVPFMLFVWVVFTSFFVLTVVMLIRRWHSINHKLLGLLGGLSLSPSVGIILVDILFNKNLTQYR
jgi:4-amino-4-deoxy-L-arabinose transferase-like glycosyltransferase